MDTLLFVAIGAAIGGLISAVISLVGHSRAERSLVEVLKQNETEDRILQLRNMRAGLESDPPDPEEVTRARQLLVGFADMLNKKQRNDIVETLDKGSDKSKANYIVKLVDEVGG
jgi:hypothetical protein